jgi:hypothetical protein
MSDRCTICDTSTIVEWHHTVPRSRGGENSLQIPLCSVCHRALHFSALAIKSKIQSGRPIKKVYWKSADEQKRAEPYLQILVRALLMPIPEGMTRNHLISVSVDTETFELFKLLQLDLGISSQEETIIYCLRSAIEQRGLNNGKRHKLWFQTEGS